MGFSNWFFVSWIKKYESNRLLYKFLYSFVLILFIFTLWINIFILPFIYLGILLQRKKSFKNVRRFLTRLRKRHKIFFYFIIGAVIFGFILICLMIFTIPLLLLIWSGIYLERRKTIPRVIHNPYNVENIQLRKDKNILSQGRL